MDIYNLELTPMIAYNYLGLNIDSLRKECIHTL